MTRTGASYFEALLGVAVVAWLTSAQLPVIGLASSALLFLLPVLLAATRGGTGPGLLAALTGASAYNYFLLEPRYTFNVHELDNLVQFSLPLCQILLSELGAFRRTRYHWHGQRWR